MYCAKCRAKVETGDEVCKNCGARLVLPKAAAAEKIRPAITVNTPAQTRNFNIETIIGKTFSIFADNALLFITLGACSGAGGLLKLAVPETALPVFKLAGNLTAILFSLVFYVVLIILAYNEYNGRNDPPGEVFDLTLNLLPALTLIAVIYYLMVFLGFILLIVPGIYALTVFSVADAVYLAERKKVGECFMESRRLIKGHFFDVFTAVFIFMFLLPLLVGIGGVLYEARTGAKLGAVPDELIDFFTGIFIVPLGSISTVVIYMQAKRDAAGQAAGPAR